MDPYSGLVEMFEKAGLLEKTGNRLRYVSKRTGEEIIEFRKNWTGEKLDVIMEDLALKGDIELSSEEATDFVEDVVVDNETVTEE
jgi:polyhydroxyalkanoate synthesis regulator phasin